MQKQYLEVGRIVGTHGIRGEMRVECWANSPDFLRQFKQLYLDEGKTALEVVCRPHKNIALMTAKGVGSIEEADRLRGKVLYIDRRDVKLEEGEHFVQDIIGLSVTDAENDTVYGVVKDVLKTGSNDVYEMKAPDGKLCYIPVIPDILDRFDFDAGKVYIRPMKGLFDDED
ncbi:ribosome maturation factor RimM [Ruminococcus sp.]|uniref:ribosome maturation factor RimM n=1 Tax=Ruminococcus sp. TaxID=41978 RepID=UPI00389031DF